jgi:hypothetical protein
MHTQRYRLAYTEEMSANQVICYVFGVETGEVVDVVTGFQQPLHGPCASGTFRTGGNFG